MSQRLLSFLIVVVIFIVGGALAWTNGVFPPLTDISANLLTFAAPIVGVFVTLNSWFNVLDSRVADGSLKPGDILGMLTMPTFITAMVACLAGVFQSFGLKVIDPTAQTFIVDSVLVLINVLLRSFSERTPTATITKSQLVAVQKVQNAEGQVVPPRPKHS